MKYKLIILNRNANNNQIEEERKRENNYTELKLVRKFNNFMNNFEEDGNFNQQIIRNYKNNIQDVWLAIISNISKIPEKWNK